MDIKKVIAKLPTGYLDEVITMNGEGLRSEIIRAETAIREVMKEQAADEKLQGAKELVKDFVGGYNDAKKAQRAKIEYLLHMLEERGELGIGLSEDEDFGSKKPAKKSRAA
ncbi:MAG: hypothetical protein Q8Q09_13330 [Deltaproteobacteria bacterium]|nr:hypothetical protein [Deltaproteobacteria bacterium]